MTEAYPSTSRQTFRDAMSLLGAAVSIITTDGPAGRHGITASAVCSVTDTPPTLLVCVNRTSSVHDMIAQNGVLCVNVLGHGGEALAKRFATSGMTPIERFADGTWTQLATGAPALEKAIVNLDCRIGARHEIGTHSVFYAEVAQIMLAGGRQSLVYFDRSFHMLGADFQRAAP